MQYQQNPLCSAEATTAYGVNPALTRRAALATTPRRRADTVMDTDRRRLGHPPGAQVRGPWAIARRWCLQSSLRLAQQRIDSLERQLAGEFATLDMRPLYDELEALEAERAELLKRLA